MFSSKCSQFFKNVHNFKKCSFIPKCVHKLKKSSQIVYFFFSKFYSEFQSLFTEAKRCSLFEKYSCFQKMFHFYNLLTIIKMFPFFKFICVRKNSLEFKKCFLFSNFVLKFIHSPGFFKIWLEIKKLVTIFQNLFVLSEIVWNLKKSTQNFQGMFEKRKSIWIDL